MAPETIQTIGTGIGIGLGIVAGWAGKLAHEKRKGGGRLRVSDAIPTIGDVEAHCKNYQEQCQKNMALILESAVSKGMAGTSEALERAMDRAVGKINARLARGDKEIDALKIQTDRNTEAIKSIKIAFQRSYAGSVIAERMEPG